MLRIQIYRNVYKNLMQVSVSNTLFINLLRQSQYISQQIANMHTIVWYQFVNILRI